MTAEPALEMLLLHPVPASEPGAASVPGSLYWRLDAGAEIHGVWDTAVQALRAKSYQLVRFDEGDAAAFKYYGEAQPYDAEQALRDFQEAFPRFKIALRSSPEFSRDLARINEGALVRCTALVPVEKLQLMEGVEFDGFRMHPAVDGYRTQLEHHPWGVELCDVDAAKRDPHWYPKPTIGLNHRAGLLRYPLIEIELDVPVSMIYLAECSAEEQHPLAHRVLDLADSCFDLVRAHCCSYEELESLPGLAGRMRDGTCAFYLMPAHQALRHELYLSVPEVLSVRSTHFGLQIERLRPNRYENLASLLLVGRHTCANQGVLRHALRTTGSSFYLISPEARFLQIVYALDALAGLDRHTTGSKHRRHITALTCWWSDADLQRSRILFEEKLELFTKLYAIRNRIVHQGATFAAMGCDAAEAAEEMSFLVRDCYETLMEMRLESDAAIRAYVGHVLEQVAGRMP